MAENEVYGCVRTYCIEPDLLNTFRMQHLSEHLSHLIWRNLLQDINIISVAMEGGLSNVLSCAGVMRFGVSR